MSQTKNWMKRSKTKSLTKSLALESLKMSLTSPPKISPRSMLADQTNLRLWGKRLAQQTEASLLNGLFEALAPLSPEATACLALGIEPTPLDPEHPTPQEAQLANELADRFTQVQIVNPPQIRLNCQRPAVKSTSEPAPQLTRALEPPAS